MLESDIQKLIMLAVAKQGHVLFRNNTAQGWAGQSRTMKHGSATVVCIDNPRPLYAGLCKGSSDLIGWTSCGLFLAVEVKRKGQKPTAEQANFVAQVNKAGGIAIVATSDKDATDQIATEIYRRRLAASCSASASK